MVWQYRELKKMENKDLIHNYNLIRDELLSRNIYSFKTTIGIKKRK